MSTRAIQALRMKQSIAYASIKKCKTMLLAAGPDDNRIRGMLNHHGATTGRSTNSLVQFQNMKRPTIDHSEAAYQDICDGMDLEMFRLCHGAPLEAISSCVRHFVHCAGDCPECEGFGDCGACDGDGYVEHPMLDADYSAIEARIVCWLAGQEDALDEFRAGVDRYKRMASAVYRIPENQVTKFPQRFVGKSLVLGAGFGLGPRVFRTSCKKVGKYDLPEGLEFTAIETWRQTHPMVPKLWKGLEKAAKEAIAKKGQLCTYRKISFKCRDIEGTPFLLMRLPSGRKLAYPRPRVVPHSRFEGNTEIVFFGHQKGVQWGNVTTWGGTLAENCLAGDTEVLTEHRGWVRLDSVKVWERVHDGVDFVHHQGLFPQGRHRVIDLHGMRVTPDHQFLAGERWISAQTACMNPHIELSSPYGDTSHLAALESHRAEVRGNDSSSTGAGYRKENNVDLQMRVRDGIRETWGRSSEGGEARMLQAMPICEEPHFGVPHYPFHVSSPCVCSLEEYAGKMFQPQASRVAKLRGQRYNRLPSVAGFFRELLAGYGAKLQNWFGHRPGGQQRKLHAEELPMGNEKTELPKQTEHRSLQGSTAGLLGRSFEARNQKDHSRLPDESRIDLETGYQYPGEHEEQVFDLLNCGPRHQFAVRGRTGRVLISHNCTQAVAADIMCHGAHNCEDAGYEIMSLIHDQSLCYKKEGQTPERLVELLTDLPDWASGLPIAAEGSETPFYRKG